MKYLSSFVLVFFVFAPIVSFAQEDIPAAPYSMKNNFSACDTVTSLQNPDFGLPNMGEFYDISSSLHYEKIRKFQAVGLVNGFEDGNFRPQSNITRAEFLKIALIAHCYDYSDLRGTTNFRDVPSATWQARVLEKAMELRMVNGDTNAE